MRFRAACLRLLTIGFLLCAARAFADDGYRLWLRYDRITDEKLRADYSAATTNIVLATPSGAESPTIAAARDELTTALRGLLATEPQISLAKAARDPSLSPEAFTLQSRNSTLTI